MKNYHRADMLKKVRRDMDSKKKMIPILFGVLCISMFGACDLDMDKLMKSDNYENVKSTTKEIYAMDTVMQLTAYGVNSEQAVDEAIKEIQRLDDTLSVGKKESDINKLNEYKSLDVSDDTRKMIDIALDIHDKSEGAFDISIYPLMEEWGFTNHNYKVVDDDRLRILSKNVDATKIMVSGNKVTIPKEMKIDLGGIAKGYTSSLIMNIFEKYNVDCGIVSLGGNVQTYGKKKDESEWNVGIEHPHKDGTYVGVVKVSDAAVITSGDYQRYFEKNGKIYHHILEPQTGKPSDNGISSVTIVGKDGAIADALSTTLFVLGEEKAIEFWRKYKDELEFEVVIVSDDGAITITKGLKDKFTSEYEYEVKE